MLMLTSVNYIDRTSLSVAMPLIGEELGLDPAMQGLILSSFFWTYAFMQVPGGVLADFYKPRIVIAVSTVGWGFFQAVAAVSTNWVMLLLTRLGLGATEAPIYLVVRPQQPARTSDGERTRGSPHRGGSCG
jgi:ACS family D-galactonate transporter-like MFS transporter